MAVDAASPAVAFLQPLILIGAAVIMVPVFRRLGLGSILGYLAAGIAIGPSALKLFGFGGEIMHVAELGIVMFLFLIGLELKPSRLWSLRHVIFGLGGAQILATAALGTLVGVFGFNAPWRGALIVAFGMALSSTALAMQTLEEKGEVRTDYGEKAFGILLMQDLAIVPLLALVTLLSPVEKPGGDGILLAIAEMVIAVGGIVVAGRYLLNPLFRVLASAGAREIMTAAALFVVIGAASLVALAGLSMATGAFLAGVLLAESNFRHQLEADIEPFRGLLMGLFFMSVGMTVDPNVIVDQWGRVLAGVIAVVGIKVAVTYALMRATRNDHDDAIRVALLLAQGGEFGFVLYANGVAADIIKDTDASLLVAVVTLSMAVTPLLVALAPRLMKRQAEEEIQEDFTEAQGSVLMIGFGRFGQVVSQLLNAEGIDVTAIDNDPEMIRAAGRFGFKVYYGDGTRLDVLRAAGAENAKLIAITTDKSDTTNRVVDLIKSEFPLAKVYARSFDRRHTLELLGRNVDYQIRETYESAIAFGRASLEELGLSPERTAEIEDDVRRRDMTRLTLQQAEGIMAGTPILQRPTPKAPTPEPLTQPKRSPKALNRESEDLTKVVD